MTTLNPSDIHDLQAALRGTLLRPGDADYDAARTIWNAMIDRRPALIARCAGVADVLAALNFARARDLPFTVRGGGHNIAGSSLCDDGLLIDLSGMKSVHIDPVARRALVEPGATLGDFDHEAQAFGLATPLGLNSTTGVAGLTLGGGIGWLNRTLGMTVDNLVAADVIVADGRLLHVSETEHPDLFWALRGGGGNFGIVTSFEFQLHPVGPQVTAGMMVFPATEAKDVLTRWRDLTARLPEDISVWAVRRKAPPLPFLAPQHHGADIVALVLFSPLPLEALQPLISRLRGFGMPLGEHIDAMPYAAWQQAFDPLLAPGARNYWKSHNFTSISDKAIDTVLAHADQLPGPQCEIFFGLLGGQASVPASTDTAYSQRDAMYVMNLHARWDAADDDARHIDWARDVFAATKPYASGGVYVNFMTQDESERVAEAYGGNYQRLRQIKAKYDPANLFRNNLNITPAS